MNQSVIRLAHTPQAVQSPESRHEGPVADVAPLSVGEQNSNSLVDSANDLSDILAFELFRRFGFGIDISVGQVADGLIAFLAEGLDKSREGGVVNSTDDGEKALSRLHAIDQHLHAILVRQS